MGFCSIMIDMEKIRPNALLIINKNGKLLAQKGYDEFTNQSFCRLLGGGIEFGEYSLIAMKREIKEELGANILNEKMLLVIENIFEFNNKKGHEITFLYSGDLAEENLYNQEKIKILDEQDTYAEWINISDIKEGSVILYPKEAVNYL